MGSLSISNIVLQLSDVSALTETKNTSAEGNGSFEMLLTQVGKTDATSPMMFDATTDVSQKLSQTQPKEYRDGQVNGLRDKLDTNPDNENVMTTIKEEATDAIAKIEEKIQEIYNVSQEEIEDALETLGLTNVDLLNLNSLAQVVTELTGAETQMELLMDAQFLDFVQSVSDILIDLEQNVQMNMTQIQAALEIPEEMTPVTEEESLTQMPLVEEELSLRETDSQQVISTEEVPMAQTFTKTEDVTVVMTEGAENVLPTDEVMTENLSEESFEEEDSETYLAEEETDSRITKQDTKEEVMDFSIDRLQEKTREVSEDVFEHTTVQVDQSKGTEQVVTTKTETVTTYLSEDTARSIVTQVTRQVFVQITNATSTMEMQLNPENLGKMILQVTTKANEVSAQILTESQAVKQALESQLVVLKENLESQGYKVNAVEVTVEERAFDKNLDEGARDRQREQDEPKPQKRRNLHLGALDDLKGLMSEEETLIAKIMKENGNTMDVIA